MGWKTVAEKAKKDHRPSLKDWSCDGFHKTFPEYSNKVLNQGNMGYQHFTCKGEDFEPYSHTIPKRLDAKDISPQEFRERYEAHGIPCVITSVPEGFDAIHETTRGEHDSHNEEKKSEHCHYHDIEQNVNSKPKPWRALERWKLEALDQDEHLRERRLKCGEHDSGKSIRIRLKHFLRYLHNNIDDSPLYIFDSSFDDDSVAKSLLSDYRVPTFFDEDLFKLVSESRRPPYRWFLVGPERSGTCVHIDPLATSAWNTLIVGKKRWVLFPPNVPKSIVKGNGLIRKGEDDEAVHYFTTILPRIKQAAIESGGEGKYQDFECYEFTQYEGETVYIPNGWWHAVLNLTHTVGVTQNFCSSQNFDQVWKKTRTGRKKMAYKWLLQLDEFYPHLAKRAREINARDNFVMKYDPQEVARREREDERQKQKRRI
jgi:histone arginine demethylase JMJD6